MSFSEEEIKAAKSVQDSILSGELPTELKSIYMAGEICMWNELSKSQSGDLEPNMQTMRDMAIDAWHSAANAYRLYPENKHTFVDYWNNLGKERAEQYISKIKSVPVGEQQEDDKELWRDVLINHSGTYDINRQIEKLKSKYHITRKQ